VHWAVQFLSRPALKHPKPTRANACVALVRRAGINHANKENEMAEIKTAFAVVQVSNEGSNPNPTVLSSSAIDTISAESEKGRFHVQFSKGFFNAVPAVVVTQIYNGTENGGLAPISCRGYSGGNTKDNVVVICVQNDFCRIKTGDDGGGGQYRSFSIVAHGV
jgi:hypothetical protein